MFDACAAIALLKDEEGADIVAALLKDEVNSVCMHAINVCEVYCDYLRSESVDEAEQAMETLRGLVGIIEDVSEDFRKRVARWKVNAPQLKAWGDAFAAATAEEHGCPLVTADHNDFGEIAKSGEIEVSFFR